MNKFEESLRKYLSEDDLHKLGAVRIGIAGCGGLGSNCAFNLVRSGFKKFVIADFDKVESSNLNRQFYFLDQVGEEKVEALKLNLSKINPDVEIDTLVERIEPGNSPDIFKDCDIIVEAFDKAECKSMLVEELLPSGKLIVSASGLAGYGRTDEITVNRLKDNLVVVGDLKTGINESPPLSPRVNVAAAKQADIILEYILTENS